MKIQITILTIILSLTLVSAMYGGENKTIEFSFETDNCTIIPNASEGINLTFSGNNILIETKINFVGSFNITCYDWLTRKVETQEESYGDGGYYTYPWRKKNETETNETIDKEELIIEEPKEEIEKKSYLKEGIIIGTLSLLIIIILIVGYLKKRKKKNHSSV